MPIFHTYPKLHSKALVVGFEKRQTALVRYTYTLSDQENQLRNLHLFEKILQNLRIDGVSKNERLAILL